MHFNLRGSSYTIFVYIIWCYKVFIFFLASIPERIVVIYLINTQLT